MQTFENTELKSKRVIVRADLNLPIHNGKIQDLTRVNVLKDTIKTLKNAGAKIILISHFGRPNGKYNEEFSMDFLQPLLEKLYHTPVHFCHDLSTEEAQSKSLELPDGEIMLCENLRFYPGEEINDQDFAETISKLGDMYVNDAFSCSHRAHASVVGITNFLPSFAGLSLSKELMYLNKSMDEQLSPKMLIIGGFKVSTKFKVLERLIQKMDCIAIGGAMANTFLQGLGYNMASSYVEGPFVRQALSFYNDHKDKILLPVDLVCDVNGHVEIYDISSVPTNAKALDLGPKTIDLFLQKASQSRLVMWNGPLGYYEDDKFAKGSISLGKGISDLTIAGQVQSIIGGGDTIAAIEKSNTDLEFTYASSSGGAFLEWLEGIELPGLKALTSNH